LFSFIVFLNVEFVLTNFAEVSQRVGLHFPGQALEQDVKLLATVLK